MGSLNPMSKLWGTLKRVTPPLAGIGAFIQQTTSADVAYAQSSGFWASTPWWAKLGDVGYWTLSRITFGKIGSITIGGQNLGPVTPSFNIGNVLNKYTGLGIAGLVYSMVAGMARGRGHSKFLPEGRFIGKMGGTLLGAGILGGLLDDAGAFDRGTQGQTSVTLPQYPRSALNLVSVTS